MISIDIEQLIERVRFWDSDSGLNFNLATTKCYVAGVSLGKRPCMALPGQSDLYKSAVKGTLVRKAFQCVTRLEFLGPINLSKAFQVALQRSLLKFVCSPYAFHQSSILS
jgi:hypothetical protein